jgi:hypothetical protein
MMHSHSDAIAQAVAGNGKGPLTPATIDKLRKAQSDALNSRWEAMLEDLRRRAPFKGLPSVEQDRAFLRLARLSRSVAGRKPRRRVQRDSAMSDCSPGWQEIAALGPDGFDFGSADVPQIVPANDYNPGDNITGNSTVAVTFPQEGQIGIGAATGAWCDIVWEPTQTFFRLQGNRSSASLTKGFYVPNLPNLAPGALTATCNVLLPSPDLALIAGDPQVGGELATMVWICGQATLDVVACNIVDAIFGAPNPSKSASDSQELFIESGFGQEDKNITNALGGNWDTVISDVDPSGVLPAYELAATISQPLATSDFVIVTVSVEVSAWSLPSIQSIAFVDATGQNTGLPLLTAPGFIRPYTNTSADNSSFGTQPIQVTDLRVCGI